MGITKQVMDMSKQKLEAEKNISHSPVMIEEVPNQLNRKSSNSRQSKIGTNTLQKVKKASANSASQRDAGAEINRLIIKQQMGELATTVTDESKVLICDSEPKSPINISHSPKESLCSAQSSKHHIADDDEDLLVQSANVTKINNTEKTGQEAKKDPGEFQKIEYLLHEFNVDNECEESYEDVFTQTEDPKQYAHVASMNFQQWIEIGNEILAEHQELMSKMISNRANLSYKFQVITRIINERAQMLMNQGAQFEAKLERIQSIGKEILDII